MQYFYFSNKSNIVNHFLVDCETIKILFVLWNVGYAMIIIEVLYKRAASKQ